MLPRRKPRVTKKALAQARALALAGDADRAVEALTWMADAPNASASSSLAELLAFRGDWPESLRRVGALLVEPGAVYAGNVFDDMTRLAMAAGDRGVPWADVAAAVDRATAALDEEPREHLRQRRGARLAALAKVAASEGGDAASRAALDGVRSREEDREGYESAVARVAELRPKLLDDPLGLTRHCFALAVNAGVSDAVVERFRECPDAIDLSGAVEVAVILVERGERDEAWSAIEARLPSWHPVDAAQVAPVGLLVDPRLDGLCSPERAREVLATPRGPAAG